LFALATLRIQYSADLRSGQKGARLNCIAFGFDILDIRLYDVLDDDVSCIGGCLRRIAENTVFRNRLESLAQEPGCRDLAFGAGLNVFRPDEALVDG
jgi:hypothetical protein